MDKFLAALVGHEKLVILLELGHVFCPEAPAETGSDQLLFSFVEVDAGLFVYKTAEEGEFFFGKLEIVHKLPQARLLKPNKTFN
jgi:hypothetical protein